jgi:hypothetical protein
MVKTKSQLNKHKKSRELGRQGASENAVVIAPIPLRCIAQDIQADRIESSKKLMDFQQR